MKRSFMAHFSRSLCPVYIVICKGSTLSLLVVLYFRPTIKPLFALYPLHYLLTFEPLSCTAFAHNASGG